MEFRRRKKKEHLEECEEGHTSCHQCLAQYKRKDKNQHNCFKDMRDIIYMLKNQNDQLKNDNQDLTKKMIKLNDKHKLLNERVESLETTIVSDKLKY